MTEDEHYDQEWKKWITSETFNDNHHLGNITDSLKKELDLYSGMSVEEYTLFVKHNELHSKYNVLQINGLFGTQYSPQKDIGFEKQIRNDIWSPTNIDDYLKLEPELLLCKNNPVLNKIRNALNDFITTGKNQNNIGRNLYYIVRDKITLKYLGIITISSDYLDLTCRDNKIGWDKKRKTNKMIKHSAVCSALVPTQPLGYNYVGGKLLSLLVLSDQVQNDYKRIYGDKLVHFTTTSLYGSFSQYTRLKYWKKLGSSNGSVVLKPRDRNLINLMKDWIKFIEPERYFKWWVVNTISGQRYTRDHISRFFIFCYSKLNIPKSNYISGHKRGVYCAELYTNTKEFLREEITENQLIPKFDYSIEALTNIWKTKYANKRIDNLVKNDRVLNDVLYYDDILFNDWDTIKERYLKQVGR